MKQATCIECGSAPVNHTTEWWSNWFEHWSTTYLQPLEKVRQLIQPLISLFPWNGISIVLVCALAFLKIIKIYKELLPEDNSRTVALWEAARQRKIVIERITLLGRPTEFSIATYNNKSRIYMSMPRPFGRPTNAFYWMDNKSKMGIEFTKVNLPVPQSYECSSKEQAVQAFQKIKSSVIVKPTYGSRSRHTLVGISSEQDLVRAFGIAQQISPWVMVQQELPGMVHRVLWVGNKVVAVMRREPAYVTGDGQNTVKQLVELENKNSLRNGPIFHHLPTDQEALEQLEKYGMSWQTIPSKGQIVILNPKVSRGNGAVNVDVTSQTHPDNMKLFQDIGTFIGDPLVGLDFIIQDITQPWQNQLPCGVIECNAMPYIDLHSHPFSGSIQDGAGALWEIVFPELTSTSK